MEGVALWGIGGLSIFHIGYKWLYEGPMSFCIGGIKVAGV